MELDLASVHEGLGGALDDRPCLVWRGRTWTWSEVTERTRRLANVLRSHGLGRHRDLAECEGWESPHDHVALYLTNGNHYLEAMLGAAKAGAAAFNVNYRYVADELAYLLNDAGAAAVIYHGRFAATLGAVLPRLDRTPLLLRVDDGTPDSLLPGAVDIEAAMADASPSRPDVDWRPDDLYVLYTGGTTGNPKGVLWRQADFIVGALGVHGASGGSIESLDELVDAARGRNLVTLPAPPFMHGAAHWNALSTWISGGTVVVQDTTDRLDPADVLDTCQRHQVTSLLVVGDAFARPVIDEQKRRPRDLSHLRFLLTGGAILSPALRRELTAMVPELRIVDVLGSSETGRQAVAKVGREEAAAVTRFVPGPDTVVLNEERTASLAAGDPHAGWLASTGAIPRGYLGDERKTRATFPEVDGRRWAVAGDRARWRDDGSIELLGRDSVTINTGGEKVFAEEVEQALKHHPAVYDALVVGRPSEKWGQEVVAVVAVRPGDHVELDDLRKTAGEHIASYKLPKSVVVRDAVSRSPSGKPDYAWAREQVQEV